MVDYKDLVKTQIDDFPKLAVALSVGLLGFVVIGGIYCACKRLLSGHSLSLRSIVADVFPRDIYDHFSTKIDIFHFLPVALLFSPLATLIVALLGAWIGIDVMASLGSIFGKSPPWLGPVWAIVAVQFIGNFIGYELGQYLGHYALHRVPWLWAVHRAHHSAETLSFFTNPRAHPIEYVILTVTRLGGAALGTGLALYLTGTPLLPATTSTLAFVNVYVIGTYAYLSHSHMPIAFGRRFNIIIGGPVMHQLHHSAEVHHRDKNLGGTTYIFDWLFGTLYLPKEGEVYRWGLNDEEYGERNPYQRYRDFYLEPLLDGWRYIHSRWLRVSH